MEGNRHGLTLRLYDRTFPGARVKLPLAPLLHDGLDCNLATADGHLLAGLGDGLASLMLH